MYEELARYYDALVKDDAATNAWVDLITTHVPIGDVLELACGSGEITIALAHAGYTMHASDQSVDMIRVAKAKQDSHLVEWSVQDMRSPMENITYDGILCLCDSFNYLLKDDEVRAFFQNVYDHLRDGGCFLMDMHAMDRLIEFRDEYHETGHIAKEDVDVQWTIVSEEDRIYQNFAFYHPDGTMCLEQHQQRVYDPLVIKKYLEEIGFTLTIYTDFTKPGIVAGEKQFYIGRRMKK